VSRAWNASVRPYYYSHPCTMYHKLIYSRCPTIIQTGPVPSAVVIRLNLFLPRGPVQMHPLAHPYAVSAAREGEVHRAYHIASQYQVRYLNSHIALPVIAGVISLRSAMTTTMVATSSRTTVFRRRREKVMSDYPLGIRYTAHLKHLTTFLAAEPLYIPD
jgi:hypothetical protein